MLNLNNKISQVYDFIRDDTSEGRNDFEEGDGFKICQNYDQVIGRVIDVSFDLNKVLEKNIHLAVEDARGKK